MKKFWENTTMKENFKSLLKQNFHEKVLTITENFFKQYKLIETMHFIAYHTMDQLQVVFSEEPPSSRSTYLEQIVLTYN